MKSAFAFLALLCSFAVVHAEDPKRPIGINCQLKSPPEVAGEEFNHGITLRIFPRAKEIGSSYTGCQVVFAPESGNWAVVSLTEVVKGDPVRIWSDHERDYSVLVCRFKNGKVTRGNPNQCPAPEFLLVKSLAPGCVRILQDSVAKYGVSGPHPAECSYE